MEVDFFFGYHMRGISAAFDIVICNGLAERGGHAERGDGGRK